MKTLNQSPQSMESDLDLHRLPMFLFGDALDMCVLIPESTAVCQEDML